MLVGLNESAVNVGGFVSSPLALGEHVTPSPVKPVLHAHVGAPDVNVHVAFGLQPPLFVRHGFAPPAHTPLVQTSLDVFGLPSSHGVASGSVGVEHVPVAWSMHAPATWHWSLAVQVTPAHRSMPAHVPPAQTSVAVFGLPSSHAAPFGRELPPHVPPDVHWSPCVQELPSSQTEPRERRVPLHTPATDDVHWSFCVHVLPSSHAVPALAK
jgi:hypothetical protein